MHSESVSGSLVMVFLNRLAPIFVNDEAFKMDRMIIEPYSFRLLVLSPVTLPSAVSSRSGPTTSLAASLTSGDAS